jgi:hypothetical protein
LGGIVKDQGNLRSTLLTTSVLAWIARRSEAWRVTFQDTGGSTGRTAAELGGGLSFAIAQNRVPGLLGAFVDYDATLAAHLARNAFAASRKRTG